MASHIKSCHDYGGIAFTDHGLRALWLVALRYGNVLEYATHAGKEDESVGSFLYGRISDDADHLRGGVDRFIAASAILL